MSVSIICSMKYFQELSARTDFLVHAYTCKYKNKISESMKMLNLQKS